MIANASDLRALHKRRIIEKIAPVMGSAFRRFHFRCDLDFHFFPLAFFSALGLLLSTASNVNLSMVISP